MRDLHLDGDDLRNNAIYASQRTVTGNRIQQIEMVASADNYDKRKCPEILLA